MNYGDAKKEHMVWVVRKMLVRRPDATAVELCKYLAANGYPNVQPNFANKLKRKAIASRIHGVSLQIKKLAFGEYDDTLLEVLAGLWNAAMDSGIAPSLRLMAYALIAKISKQRRDAFLESGLSETKEVVAQPTRETTMMPPAMNDQWQNLKDLGMLTPELAAPDPTVLEIELEQQEDEEKKIHNAEFAEQEKEKQKQRELEEIRLNLARAKKAQSQSWPQQAYAFPFEVRIQKFRETWGKGEAAIDWDLYWDQNKGNKGPCPI